MDFSLIQLNQNLPISLYEEKIANAIKMNNNLIVIGETGSGKTTQIPLICLKTLSKYQNLLKGKIAVTQPRRIAATSIAKYVSEFTNTSLGKYIGYKIRFDEVLSDNTVLIFMTDGILLREIQINPLLNGYSLIMIDEAHERNINSDFLIGLLIDIQNKRKELDLSPIQIIVTSATLEKDKFINFFNQESRIKTEFIEIPGKLYPVHSFFLQKEIFDYEYFASLLVEKICTLKLKDFYPNIKNYNLPKEGDILIFMPGKGEIEKTKFYIEQIRKSTNIELEVFTVHGDMTIQQQNNIFLKTNKRKVIIATNIAETSLTIPGIRYVIDSGLIKVMEYDPHIGINSLNTKLHAIKGLEQRRGRAGRIEEGFYFALYTKESLKKREEYPVPEIKRISLAQIILIMKYIGIKNIENFKFIDKPSYEQIENSIQKLKQIGALDQKTENITDKGKTMANLPLDPLISNLMLEGNKFGCIESISIIASFLELKPVFLTLTEEEIFKNEIKSKILEKYGEDFYFNLNNGNLYDSNILTKEELKEVHKKASKQYKIYNIIQNKFKIINSDIKTLIHIFREWIKNQQNPEWAEKNYLSSETLIEATNIKNELLKIAKENGLNTEDKIGFDLEKRIEKAIINAFKFNILALQKNKLYMNLSSGDKNIKINNSSVLYKTKPKLIVALEIIQITDIDSQKTLSAKFIHAINKNILKATLLNVYKKYTKHIRKTGKHKININKKKFINRKFIYFK